MTDEYDHGITTAIKLLEAALVMRQRGDVRRNVVLARSVLHDAIATIDLQDKNPQPSCGHVLLGRRGLARPAGTARASPRFDVGAQPEQASSGAHFDDRLGEVVAAPVGAHARSVAETEELGDALSVDQVRGVDLRGHDTTLLIGT